MFLSRIFDWILGSNKSLLEAKIFFLGIMVSRSLQRNWIGEGMSLSGVITAILGFSQRNISDLV